MLACGIDGVRFATVGDQADEPKRGMRRRLHVLQLERLEPTAQHVGLRSAELRGESLKSRQ